MISLTGRWRRIGALAGLTLALLMVDAGPAGAADPTETDATTGDTAGTGTVAGLHVQVRAADPLAPAVVLTNEGPANCVVAGTSVGTVGFTRFEQGGTAVEPMLYDAQFSEDLGFFLTAGLRSLAPGESVELPIRVVPVGPTGHAVDSVSWSAEAGAIGVLYPVRTGEPLVLEAVYGLPVRAPDGQAACVMGVGSAPPPGAASWQRWALLAGGAALGLILLVLLVVALTRRRRRMRASAAVVLLAVTASVAVAVDGWGTPAHAAYDVHPDVADAFGTCYSIFTSPGGDPAGIMPLLEEPSINIQILPAAPGSPTGQGSISPTDQWVFWDTDDYHPYHGSGGNADPCDALYHELYHAWEDANGGQDHRECVTDAGPSGLPINEVNATKAQNQLRAAQGRPERDHYGNIPLPEGECQDPDQAPPPPPPCESGCGNSTGDPHLTTFDGRRYSFQAVGEFVAVRGSTGDLEVQVRQAPLGTSRRVSANAVVAMNVAGDRVEISRTHRAELLVDGQPAQPPARLPGGGSVEIADRWGQKFVVTWPDGSSVATAPIGVWGLRVTIRLADERAGQVEGLFGDYDGDPANDLRVRDGEPVGGTFDELYGEFADGWRVEASASLFTYGPGESTETYTDRTYPDQEARVEDLPNRAAAEAICRRLGVVEPVALRACTIDVGHTGQLDFAVAMLETQLIIGSRGIDGSETVLTVDQPGGSAEYGFDGTAGQVVHVAVPAATVPAQCGVLTLAGPDGDEIADGCIINGRGLIERATLPATGRYTLSLTPSRGATGRAWIRIVTVEDRAGEVVDGSTVDVTLAQPGALARFTFAGTANQVVFVDVPRASLTSSCGVLRLLGPDGSTLETGCVISGRGYIDRAVLSQTGTHTILVDPRDGDTGEVRLRLSFAVDQTGPIQAGTDLTATIAQPGAQARLTFTGTAGQAVFVDAPSSTLTSQCSPLRVVDAGGRQLATGCVINGRGSVDRTELPATGTYTVVVDPGGSRTGQTVLRLWFAADQTSTITIDGPEQVATPATPGSVATFTFAAAAGESVVVEATSSLPSRCSPLSIRTPAGQRLATGCVIDGTGSISRVTLPAAGVYALVVDPVDNDTGETRVRLRRA